MPLSSPIIRLALDVPLDTLFDYLAPDATQHDVGCLAEVYFGKKRVIGVIMQVAAGSALAPEKLKPVNRIFRESPPLSKTLLDLLRFCSDYYHHPLGQVVMNALPGKLRSTNKSVAKDIQPKKIKKNVTAKTAAETTAFIASPNTLTAEQQIAIKQIALKLGERGEFSTTLLHGITGSGKTEVYLQLIATLLPSGRQTLILVPEINLTPQLETIFRARFAGAPLVSLHSKLAPVARLKAWRAAQSGEAKIILGTRLAVFTPLPQLGLIVVDEEHDSSFKQQEGLRYSARDVAIFRAKQTGIPIVLGSATPALETYHNALTHRYRYLQLTQRAVADALPPRIYTIDTRPLKLVDGLSEPLLRALQQGIENKQQSLVFINRRGYAPVLLCKSCAWTAACHRCAARLVVHLKDKKLRCHHCGHQEHFPSACANCGDQDIAPFGQGTQRVEAALQARFPSARILRIDRDSTKNKHAWADMLKEIQEARVDILVGTQILAKGHDFPNLSLVGILNADAALYSTDFRAAEKLFAQLMQVAGRAGRASIPGKVLIQTEFVNHPLYSALKQHDFDLLAQTILGERKMAGFPPFVHQVLLRAEAAEMKAALDFLARAKTLEAAPKGVEVFDPVPAQMTRLKGLERAHLLAQSTSRGKLQTFLTAWNAKISAPQHQKANRKVRWSLDVDPLEF